MSKLIAGPIVRRVEARKVSVWAAFNGHYRMRLQIWEGSDIKHTGGAGKFTVGTTPLAAMSPDQAQKALRLGPGLSAGVVTIDIPPPGLVPGKLYSYNLIFEDDGTETESPPGLIELDLRTEQMLKDGNVEDRPQKALGYKNDVLPGFVMPATDPKKLIIAHGSCRKAHGYGPDALASLDGVIKTSLEDLTDVTKTRPQQLFLTGDQIYADEVPGPLLRYACNADGTGMMTEEKVRLIAGEKVADTVSFPPYTRQGLTQTQGGFTSSAAACHLVSFAEFCGIYLNYWSLRSWNNQLYEKIKGATDDEKIAAAANTLFDPGGGETGFLTLIRNLDAATRNQVAAEGSELREVFAANFAGEKFEKWKKALLKELREEIKNLKAFADKLPEVSRALANIATYMVFDDHEVTDDWYITQRWKNQTLGAGHPLGRDIIRNGLMAYAVFQDWGNKPDEYQLLTTVPADAPGRTKLFNHLWERGFRISNNINVAGIGADILEPIENLLGMGATPSAVKWHYRVPSGAATTFVLDTRTQRQYPSLNAPPALLSEAALNEQLPATPPDPGASFIIVVAPAPVLGLSSFEELIQPAASAVVGLSSDAPNPGILGGQLEFDYEAWGFNVPGFERFLDRLHQYKKVIILSGDVHYGYSSVMDYWKGSLAAPSGRFVQLTASSLKNMRFPNMEFLKSGIVQRILTGFDGQLQKVGWKDKVLGFGSPHLITPRNRARLDKATAVVPTEGWDTRATVNQPPDFRWRLRIVGDDQQAADAQDIDLNNPTSTKEGYKKVVVLHQDVFKSGKARRIAWPCNVGLITLTQESASAPLVIQHEIKIAGAAIKHKIPLVAAAGAESTRPELGV